MTAPTDALLQACLAEALRQARVWIPQWLRQVQAELGEREQMARHGHEKHSLGEARSALATHQTLLGQRFLDALCRGLAQVDRPAPAAAAATRRLNTLSVDDLELMDDLQVQQSVHLTRLQQTIRLAADVELAAFSARLSRVQGFEVLRADANPLRPEAVVKALMAALDTLHMADSVRSHWLAASATPLGRQLCGFYQQMEQWLGHQGVQPAGYMVIPSPAPRTAAAVRVAAPDTNSVPAEAVLGQNALLSLDRLHDLLAGNLAQAGVAVSDQGISGSGNAMVRTLAGELATRLLKRTTEDTHLLPTVRDMVQQLKAPLQQLARTDPRFFADRQNPARRLLDRITAEGLAFRTEQDEGFQDFARQLLSAVCSLQAPVHRVPALLADALTLFPAAAEAAVAAPRGIEPQRPVPVAQRDLLTEQLAAEFRSREDFGRAPGVVQRFVTGPWAKVVAHARLSLGVIDAALEPDAPVLRYIDVLTDLLWSSQLVLASRNRPRLIKAVPKVLRTLREGLDTIDYPRQQAEAFFHALLGLQDAAYLTQHSVDLVCEPVWADAGPRAQAQPVHGAIQVRPSAAREVDLFADSEFDPTADFSDTEPFTSDWLALTGRELPPVAEGLAVGDWVELNESGRTVRCRLSWASPHGRLFQFAAPQGRSISLSRSGLLRMHSAGRLRVVPEAAGLMTRHH